MVVTSTKLQTRRHPLHQHQDQEEGCRIHRLQNVEITQTLTLHGVGVFFVHNLLMIVMGGRQASQRAELQAERASVL